MSEKKRRKKDGEDKNKDNQRMREVNHDSDKKNLPSSQHEKSESSRQTD